MGERGGYGGVCALWSGIIDLGGSDWNLFVGSVFVVCGVGCGGWRGGWQGGEKVPLFLVLTEIKAFLEYHTND